MELFVVVSEDVVYSIFDTELRAIKEACSEILGIQCYDEHEENELIRLYYLGDFKGAYEAAVAMEASCGFKVVSKTLNKSNYVDEDQA